MTATGEDAVRAVPAYPFILRYTQFWRVSQALLVIIAADLSDSNLVHAGVEGRWSCAWGAACFVARFVGKTGSHFWERASGDSPRRQGRVHRLETAAGDPQPHQAVEGSKQAGEFLAMDKARAAIGSVVKLEMCSPSMMARCPIRPAQRNPCPASTPVTTGWKVLREPRAGRRDGQSRPELQRAADLADVGVPLRISRGVGEESADALILPSMPCTAAPIATLMAKVNGKDEPCMWSHRPFQSPHNLTGCPAVSLSMGFSRQGMPLSLQIVGRESSEGRVLGIANAYEEATPELRSRRPNL